MRLQFFLRLLTLLSTFTFTFAQVSSNNFISPGAGDTLVAGEAFTLRWGSLSGTTVTITLVGGPSNALVTVAVIAQGIDNTGQFTWDVPTNIPTGSYAFRIQPDIAAVDPNYSDRFTLQNDNSISSSTSLQTPTSSPPPSTTPIPSTTSIPSSTSESLPPTSSSTTTPRPTTSPSPSSSSSSSSSSRPESSTNPPQTTTGTTQSTTSSTSPNTSTNNPPAGGGGGSSGPNAGVIAGSVVGGVAVLGLIGLLAFWILVRERRKRAAMVQPSMPPPPPADPNNQGIWDGRDAFSSNPRHDTTDVYPGQEMSQPGVRV
ncbi:hypothetical protein H072_11461 [Dactylellina haptotyla CBS 200.50]|uniref:Yeast cell wall synthesis Kre9/Knh1-like N-terminal domain-containing protein n=1 Tax=Dactylellina haptotyla (strain CBS 200.50) TaxID=1284197 RepID=S8BIV2_DACHA|nr:hypothetical protein H072_11461 [Dactylellina haptotyla CBS 200.50]